MFILVLIFTFFGAQSKYPHISHYGAGVMEDPKTPEISEASYEETLSIAATVLTYDVLLHVFTFLEQKKDLALCSFVCSLWRKVAFNPIFLWENIKQWHTEYPYKIMCLFI